MHWHLPQRKPLQPQPDTLQTLLSAMQSRLRAAGVADPRLEASILLECATGLDRTKLLRDIKRSTSDSEFRASEELLGRRLAGEPVQYIVGTAWFYGREFYVDRRVLIPRPETEVLVEQASELLSAELATGKTHGICDVGTGSGILAITLALEYQNAHVVATDVSGAALEVAHRNCVRHGVENRVRLVQCDALRAVSQQFDVVVSNPPYVRRDEIAGLQSDVRDFEPHMALDGGADGLAVVRRLLVESTEHLVENGALLLEVGSDQAGQVIDLMAQMGMWTELRTIADLSAVDRVVCGRRVSA